MQKVLIKDKSIKIYSEDHVIEDGEDVVIKVYRGYLTTDTTCTTYPYKIEHKAYIRQLSANEKYSSQALQDDSDIEIVINDRPIIQDMFVEFRGKTYKIGPADRFEFYNREVKFRAKEVTASNFTRTEIKGWS